MELLIQLLISSFPILLLIAVWIYFIRKMSGKENPQQQHLEVAQKNLEVQERIATALEKIAESR